MNQQYNFRDSICKQWFEMQSKSFQGLLKDRASRDECNVDDEDEFLNWIYHEQLGKIMQTIILGDNNTL